jgi:hypothetical protein
LPTPPDAAGLYLRRLAVGASICPSRRCPRRLATVWLMSPIIRVDLRLSVAYMLTRTSQEHQSITEPRPYSRFGEQGSGIYHGLRGQRGPV